MDLIVKEEHTDTQTHTHIHTHTHTYTHTYTHTHMKKKRRKKKKRRRRRRRRRKHTTVTSGIVNSCLYTCPQEFEEIVEMLDGLEGEAAAEVSEHPEVHLESPVIDLVLVVAGLVTQVRAAQLTSCERSPSDLQMSPQTRRPEDIVMIVYIMYSTQYCQRAQTDDQIDNFNQSINQSINSLFRIAAKGWINTFTYNIK